MLIFLIWIKSIFMKSTFACTVSRDHIFNHTIYILYLDRDQFVNAPNKWETMLQCNILYHWLGGYTKYHLWCYILMILLLPAVTHLHAQDVLIYAQMPSVHDSKIKYPATNKAYVHVCSNTWTAISFCIIINWNDNGIKHCNLLVEWIHYILCMINYLYGKLILHKLHAFSQIPIYNLWFIMLYWVSFYGWY